MDFLSVSAVKHLGSNTGTPSMLQEYKIVSAYSEPGNATRMQVLEKEVTHLMQSGWQPIGGPCVHLTNVYQAMVR